MRSFRVASFLRTVARLSETSENQGTIQPEYGYPAAFIAESEK